MSPNRYTCVNPQACNCGRNDGEFCRYWAGYDYPRSEIRRRAEVVRRRQRRGLALALLLWIVVMVLLTFSVTTGRATTGDTRYDVIASRIAGQQVTVACYTKDEYVDPYHFDPGSVGAWGYVYLEDTVVNLAHEVCDGLAQAVKGVVSPWAGLGALVLTHEAYHLALRYDNRGDEAKTECRAIKNVRTTIAALGLKGDNARATYFWALTFDWRTIWMFPAYFEPTCKRDSAGEVGMRDEGLALDRVGP